MFTGSGFKSTVLICMVIAQNSTKSFSTRNIYKSVKDDSILKQKIYNYNYSIPRNMRLSRIEIENFRSIKQLDMTLGNCTILVGKNNSGKSNIVRAIDLALGEKYVRLTKNDFFNQNELNKIGIKLHFDNLKDEEIDEIISEVKYSVWVEGEQYDQARFYTLLRDTRKVRIELEIDSSSLDRSIFLGDVYYKYFSNELKNAIITTVHIPAVRDYSQILKTTDYSFLGKLLSKLYQKAEDAKKRELELKLSNTKIVCNNIFLEHQKRLNDISNAIINHNGVTFSFIPSNPKDIYKKLEILLDDGIDTGLDFKGSGIQSVVIISLFKLYSEIKTGQALLLIEEPELYLHPHANRHMANVLRNFCDNEGVQLIITTHSSHYLLGKDVPEISLVRKNGKETIVTQVADFTDKLKLKKELNESNLELFFSDKVLLVEGQCDKIIIQSLAKSINSDYDFDKKNIGIVEVGSKSNLDVFIDLLNSYQIPWIALVDKDFIDSKGIIHRMSNRFNYGIDITNDGDAIIQQKLETKGIHVLSEGEIENYYLKDWLNMILIDFVNESDDIPQIKKASIVTMVNAFNNVRDLDALKHQVGTATDIDTDAKEFIFKILNSKAGLIQVNMAEIKVSSKLETIFTEFDLTKPKIAIRLTQHINVNDLILLRRTEFQNFFQKLFLP